VAVASAGPYASLHLASDSNHASTPPLSFLQAGCPSCRPTNSIKALKAQNSKNQFVPKGSRVMLMKQHYNTVILCGILYSAPLPLFFIFLLLLHLHFITVLLHEIYAA